MIKINSVMRNRLMLFLFIIFIVYAFFYFSNKYREYGYQTSKINQLRHSHETWLKRLQSGQIEHISYNIVDIDNLTITSKIKYDSKSGSFKETIIYHLSNGNTTISFSDIKGSDLINSIVNRTKSIVFSKYISILNYTENTDGSKCYYFNSFDNHTIQVVHSVLCYDTENDLRFIYFSRDSRGLMLFMNYS
ncbi:MAG: hypothetical protein N3E37_01830 [Candidatus Micrarchaeota archaeon]|nr:hypothetical protein [Candidatus Micrarchaeota archaeon]